MLDSQLPYLFCIDDNVLRTGLVLYHLKVTRGFSRLCRDCRRVYSNIAVLYFVQLSIKVNVKLS